jgi:ABC-type lipoprotein release transport system permease subunit
MLYTIFYTLIGIPTGYVTSVFINDIHEFLYNTNISKFGKYSIITIIIFFSFLKGYTGNDLITNILKL